MGQMVMNPWTSEEMARAGVELAGRETRLTKLKNEKKASAKVYSGEIAALEEQIEELASEIERQERSHPTDRDEEEGGSESE